MNDILVRPSPVADAVAVALARTFDLGVRTTPKDASNDEFLYALDDPAAAIGVVSLECAAWDIIGCCRGPLVLVPAVATMRPGGTPGLIDRVLVPLDGTEEAVRAVSETARLFHRAGTEIIVLHVFDRTTVPACWDQAAHERTAWETEFRARFCVPHLPHPRPNLVLRSGTPGENVVDVAARQADLIVLGWSRRLDPGHAHTVRTTIDTATVPVMLIPVDNGGRTE
ncbi:universal stress protein [Nocardia uniformis]|uniref:Universal stress protein n=1 Tax=Nocardia uniformis TaxID=53432 RepID=A0A849C2G0_9NOCA|nr:universal stress protein [Nocardia uniformis]NNH70495.1 universal stress protein [Nocardia uniformis]